jgi:hypothetical protein
MEAEDAMARESSTPQTLPEFLPKRAAAKRLGINYRTLERYCQAGVGPAYYRFGGKVLFAVPDLVVWAEARKFDGASEATQGRDHDA